jgi:deoxyadenosine/deoxycytidine kinase
MSQLIIIEGNIGVGKTTLTTNLSKVITATPIHEPVDDNPYLARFYEDPKRWALEMQFWLMSHRFNAHQDAVKMVWSEGKTVIMDRSIYGDNVFAKMHFDLCNIDEEGYQNYCNMRNVMLRFLMLPQIAIFLHASPKVCLNRVKERNRGCESGLTIEYLTKLQAHYNDLKANLVSHGTHVIDIDYEDIRPLDEILAKIRPHLCKFETYETIKPNYLVSHPLGMTPKSAKQEIDDGLQKLFNNGGILC